MIVLDASVAVKLVTREFGGEAALERVLREDERVAPDWIRVEVGNALSRKVRENGLPPTEAHSARAAVLAYLTQEVSSLMLLDSAFALSLLIGHGLYDCLYLATALRHGGTVVTADRHFAERAAKGGYAEAVELIA